MTGNLMKPKVAYLTLAGAIIFAVGGQSGVVVAQEAFDLTDESEISDGQTLLDEVEQRALQPLDGEYGSEVEQRWRAVLAEAGLVEGKNPRDVFIASGFANVAMEKGAPGWIESRRIAHDIAFARAKADLVAAMGQTIQQTGNARFVSNASFGQGHIQRVEEVEQTARILDKAADLTETMLDTALRELDPDYDAQRYEGTPMPQRQVALEDLFEQETYRIASRVIAGATTFRVIEGPSSDGSNHEVLVGLVWSPRLSALASAIGEGRTSLPVDAARTSLQEMRPATVGEAVAAMGTRVFIDENGDRAIVSFAQAEPARVNPTERDMARRAALSTAQDLALGQIASFVGENVTLESEVASTQLTQVYADLVQRGVEIETEQVQTIRAASGRVSITGAQPFWRDVVEHPETGQDVAIVAVSWSPSSQAMGERMGDAVDAARSRGSEAGQNGPEENDQDAKGRMFESPAVDPSAF
ncbi:hypothetical protein [Ectothiorhodospira sp. BSL-9]|uniref:hypothetical protein n=1 Tax=Ectothiorhodospira sp. BSL-9 TaxID=1442136 RepID=UPI0007B45595|nr:hypothetical protein [Ectothiorhodospira sp. BSL-9]ANB01766.1 hypothetical protein ECTOBSL9_0952 [Ectothiorhodospira sp. BSL-9]